LQYLTDEDIIAVYREAIGTPELRYPAGVSSAAGRPQQTVFGEDAYPTIPLKAAALMHSLAENQPFVDGNKRIAWICGKLFLQIHGYTMHATDDEAVALFLKVAQGLQVAALADWICRRISPLLSDEETLSSEPDRNTAPS
jgi:death-on-curing protein